MHREAGHDDREGAVGIGQALDRALLPGNIGEALLDGERVGALQHCRGHIDAGGMSQMGREGADDDAAAAGDIEQRIAGARLSRVDDHFERRLARDRRGG